MIGRRLGAAALVALAVAAVASARSSSIVSAQERQTFRAGTDVVLVDVSVRDGGQPVTGLSAGDFQLKDNGVLQRVESVEATAVPIDLTLVVDLSGNPRRPASRRRPASDVASALQADVDRITTLLRPDDRVRLFVVDQSVVRVWPLAPVAEQRPIQRVEFDGLASFYDTLTTALLRPVEPARRHIVIAETRGLDTMSAVGAAAVEAVARQSDALVHIVIDETGFDNDVADGAFQCAFMGFCWPTRRFWVPVRRQLIGPGPVHELLPEGRVLKAAAESTGGALHQTTVTRVPSLENTFRRVFDDFRSGYMLRYTPQGVEREGWHAIDVTVPGSRSYTVRARNGYGVEAAAAPPEPVEEPDVPESLEELTAAYGRGDFQRLTAGLGNARDPGRLIRDFDRAGNPWPATPRREAAFVLELVHTGLFESELPQTRLAAQALLQRFARLVRHPLAPDGFELYWHFAAITLAEGSLRPREVEPIVTRALERFPAEPRFVLSRAIVSDQAAIALRSVSMSRADGRGRMNQDGSADPETVISRYRAAAELPAVAAEARVRLAWLLCRLDRNEEALDLLAAAGAEPIQDEAIRYLHALVLGNTLVALERQDEAAAAFREALAVLPAAQSARVALMNVLLVQGDREAAAALAEDVQSEQSSAIDPWWMYWQGQYRFSSFALGRVRELGR